MAMLSLCGLFPFLLALTAILGLADPLYLQVGGTLDLIGNYRTESGHFLRGYNFWRDSVNAKGGVRIGNQSYLVNLTIYNDQGDSGLCSYYYNILCTQTNPRIDVLLGPYSSGLNIVALEVLRNFNMSMFVAGASSDIFFDNASYPYLFASNTRGSVYAVEMVNMLVSRGIRTFTIIAKDDPYSVSIAQGASQRIDELGARVVLNQRYHAGNSEELTSLLQQAKLLQTDAFLAMGHYTDFLLTMQLTAFLEYSPVMAGFGRGLSITPDTASVARCWLGCELWHRSQNFGIAGQYLGNTSEFVRNFELWANDTCDLYDAMGASGPVLMQQAIEAANSLDPDALNLALRSSNFTNFYGPVKLDPEGANIAKRMLVSQFSGGAIRIVGPGEAEAQMQYPAEWPWSSRVLFYRSQVLINVLQSLAVILAFLAAVTMALLWRFRTEKLVRAGSFEFMEIISFGCFLLFLSVIPYTVEPTQASCSGMIWLAHMGFALAFGSLYLKNWRIHRLFNNYTLRQLTHLNNLYLLKRMLVFFVVILIILMVWTITDPEEETYLNTENSLDTYRVCASHANAEEVNGKWYVRQTQDSSTLKKRNARTDSPFTFVIIAIEGVVLCSTVWISFQVRNATGPHAEAKQIAVAAYHTVFLAIFVGLLIALINPLNPDANVAIVSCALLLGALVILVTIVWYKLYHIYVPPSTNVSEASEDNKSQQLDQEILEFKKETDQKIARLEEHNRELEGTVARLKDEVASLTKQTEVQQAAIGQLAQEKQDLTDRLAAS